MSRDTIGLTAPDFGDPLVARTERGLSAPRALDLPAIRARAEAATPGPWLFSRQDDAIQAPGLDHDDVVDLRITSDADAAFIASARTDVPALCDEVERLRAIIAAARAALREPSEPARALAILGGS